MRPSDAFGRQRPVELTDFDVLATPLASGVSGTYDSNCNDGSAVASGSSGSPPALGISGTGLTAAPMTSYFLTDEASVDAAIEAASQDTESFRTALKHARHFYGKRQLAHPERVVPNTAHPSDTTSTSLHDEGKDTRTTDDVNIEALNMIAEAQQHQRALHGHTHSTNTLASHPSSIPPNLSPLFSQSGSTSLFGTPGPDSLSAMSSPSSRRDSLSGSLLMDDSLISSGGDGLTSHETNFDMTRGLGLGGSSFGVNASSATGYSGGPSAFGSKDASRNESAAAASRHLSASMAGLSATGSSMMDSGSAPQLVMPSIKMPSRRPFTEEGKNMGRLKVLLAGDSGKHTLQSLVSTTKFLASDMKQVLARRHSSRRLFNHVRILSTSITLCLLRYQLAGCLLVERGARQKSALVPPTRPVAGRTQFGRAESRRGRPGQTPPRIRSPKYMLVQSLTRSGGASWPTKAAREGERA